MEKRSYAIKMQTPLGVKCGTLEVNPEGNKISGFLDILNHSEPFCGHMDEYGRCSFTGRIITLMHTLEYRASGTMDEKQILLEIRSERYVFQVTGSVCQEKNEK